MEKQYRVKIWEKYVKHCAYCGQEIEYKDMQVDHIFPKYRKGENVEENYNPACRSCNSTKGTYTIEEFRERLIGDVDRMRRDSPKFRILERFGIIKQVGTKLLFYFEMLFLFNSIVDVRLLCHTTEDIVAKGNLKLKIKDKR